jgi:hypothetical protein
MRWLSFFLAFQHLNSGTKFRECEDQSWFKVQTDPVFRLDWCRMYSSTPLTCLSLLPLGCVPKVADHSFRGRFALKCMWLNLKLYHIHFTRGQLLMCRVTASYWKGFEGPRRSVHDLSLAKGKGWTLHCKEKSYHRPAALQNHWAEQKLRYNLK